MSKDRKHFNWWKSLVGDAIHSTMDEDIDEETTVQANEDYDDEDLDWQDIWEASFLWNCRMNGYSAQEHTTKVQRILEEGSELSAVGQYLDGETHFWDVVKQLRDLKRIDGIQALGMFGSRSRGDHVPLQSDLDIFVVDDRPNDLLYSESQGYSWQRKKERRTGLGSGIHLIEITSREVSTVIRNPHDALQEDERKSPVRWLWVRPGYTNLREYTFSVIDDDNKKMGILVRENV